MEMTSEETQGMRQQQKFRPCSRISRRGDVYWHFIDAVTPPPREWLLLVGNVVYPGGEAVNEFGDTFVFTGSSDAACVFSLFDANQSQASGSRVLPQSAF
jgi:hypothetical protein